jgi:hypothetical protein
MENLFNEIVEENFQDLGKEMDTQVDDVFRRQIDMKKKETFHVIL